MALRAELPVLWMIGAVLLMTLLRFILGRIKAGGKVRKNAASPLSPQDAERPALVPCDMVSPRETNAEVLPLLPSSPLRPTQAILDQLRSPGSARNAVVLREILGPPKALSPDEDRSL